MYISLRYILLDAVPPSAGGSLTFRNVTPDVMSVFAMTGFDSILTIEQGNRWRRCEGILRWKGALADGGVALRRTVAGVLALACIAMSFMQLGFLGFGLADGGSVYLVLMLAPVALGAMLLGTLWGAAMGLFGGAALYLHAVALPLDYYELTFVTPVELCECQAHPTTSMPSGYSK